MKIHDKLDEILSRGSKVKVLRYLFQAADEHTGRGIATAVGMSPSMAHSVLSKLSSGGLVDVREKGKAKLYRLRRGNHIVEKLLKPLFEGEQNLFNTDFHRVFKRHLLWSPNDLQRLVVQPGDTDFFVQFFYA